MFRHPHQIKNSNLSEAVGRLTREAPRAQKNSEDTFLEKTCLVTLTRATDSMMIGRPSLVMRCRLLDISMDFFDLSFLAAYPTNPS